MFTKCSLSIASLCADVRGAGLDVGLIQEPREVKGGPRVPAGGGLTLRIEVVEVDPG